MQHVRFSPVHPAEPVCSSSWPGAASAPPAARPAAAARCSAAQEAAAPPALPAPASEYEEKETGSSKQSATSPTTNLMSCKLLVSERGEWCQPASPYFSG